MKTSLGPRRNLDLSIITPRIMVENSNRKIFHRQIKKKAFFMILSIS